MAASTTPLDCVVIGYNDLDFESALAGAEEMKEHSPVFDELLRSSALYAGRRRPYMDILGAALGASDGAARDLHVFRLPSLGVCYLVSFLRRRGFRAEGIHFFNADRDRLEELLATRPRAVAITTTFYVDAAPIVDLVRFVRQRSPETRIVVGGPFVYNVCEAVEPDVADFVLDPIGADVFVIDSQGESALAAVLAELRVGNDDLSRVPNLAFRSGVGLRRTPRVVEDNDMDANAIDWSGFEDAEIAPTTQLRTARSCAFKCAFCRYPAVGGALALNSLEVVETQLRHLQERGVKQLVFIDDTFNVPLPRFKKLCRMLIRERFGFDWYSYFRCSNADSEAFDLMAQAGCRGTFLGIESGDDLILENMDKSAGVAAYASGIAELKRRGITTHASFIVGFPGETEQTVANTIAFIDEAAPTFFNAGVHYFDVKAPIAGQAARFGLKGSGFNWRHGTMDWRRASELTDRLYRSVRNSALLPTYMFDFWGIPYLTGQGFTVERIEAFARAVQPLLLAGLDDPRRPRPNLEKAVRDSVSAVSTGVAAGPATAS